MQHLSTNLTQRTGVSFSSYAAAIAGHDILCLDILDGLLARRIWNHAGLFGWLEVQGSVDGFAAAREKAEWLARRRFFDDRRCPARLNEIYAVLAELLPDANVTPEDEITAEGIFATGDPSVALLTEEARKAGKRVVGVTDSALPREAILALLDRESIALDGLFVATELRGSGRSLANGGIHAEIAEVTGTGLSEILYVGNSRVECRGEMSALPLPALCDLPPQPFVTPPTPAEGDALVAGLAACRAMQSPASPPFYWLGYAIGGPLLAAGEAGGADPDFGGSIPAGAGDVLDLLKPAAPGSALRQAAQAEAARGAADFGADIAWIRDRVDAKALREQAGRALTRLVLAPTAEEYSALDRIPFGSAGEETFARGLTRPRPEEGTPSDPPDIALLRLNQTFRDLLPKDLVQMAETGQLSEFDWREAFRRNPFKVSRWSTLKRYQRRVESRRRNREAGR